MPPKVKKSEMNECIVSHFIGIGKVMGVFRVGLPLVKEGGGYGI